VVFPPVDHAGVGPEAGESVSIMIASVLERSDPLQWEEGWRYLDDNQRRDYRLVTMDDEAAIARRLHARYFIDGSLARSGDSAMVTLVLNDARTGRALARASAPGPLEVGALVASGFRALIQLLPTLIDPERGVDQEALAALVSPSPVATAHWINGERLYRQADWAPALEQFRLAVALDSGMVFAALKGAQAGSWLDRQEEVQSLLGVAERHRNHLPPKYAAFLTALHHYHHGQSDSAQRSIHAALDLDPHWAEAWMVLGEIRYHLLPAVDGPPDSLASIAFRRAVAASPNFTPARYHLAELALRDGNLTEARGSIDTLLATAADTSLTVQLELMDRCLREGPDAVSWRDQLAEHAGEVYQAAVRLAPGARHTRCATAAFSALLGDATSAQRFGWPALLGLQGLLLAAGRPDAALALLDSAMVTMPGAALLYLVDATADADAGMEDRAAAVMAQLAGTYETMSAGRLWLHGLWQAHLGHGDSVAAIAARFGALVSSSDPLGAARHLALEARAAALAGRSEEALSLLGEMDPPVPADGVLAGTWQPFAAERLLRARLELSVGKPEAALRTARVFDDWNALVALAYLRPSVEVRVAAAAALGRLALADSLRRRLGDHPSIAGGDR